MARPSRLTTAVAAALVGLASLTACTDKRNREVPAATTTTSFVPPPPVERPRGGVVRVGVFGMPDPAAPTLSGAGVRTLVLPQLFTVGPDGKRYASLIVPDSDQDGPDRQSASFVLRPEAVWSDGSPITVEDLRRTADNAVVAGIEGPAPDGRITVRFKAPLPDWRRLWSDTDAIAAPAAGVWGGPFVVASVTPGLETVLRPNPRWWGKPGPFLDEVRLVLVPDATMQRQLYEKGELDVVSPPPSTNRKAQFPGAKDGGHGGWDVRLVVNESKLTPAVTKAVQASTDRLDFVGTLLRGEATTGQPGEPGNPDDAVGLEALKGKTVQVSLQQEEPMSWLVQRTMQKRARSVGGGFEFRTAEADVVEQWVASGDYEAAVLIGWEPPEDYGQKPTPHRQQWRWNVIVAARGVEGVDPNAWALTPAWDAHEWWRPGGTPSGTGTPSP